MALPGIFLDRYFIFPASEETVTMINEVAEAFRYDEEVRNRQTENVSRFIFDAISKIYLYF